MKFRTLTKTAIAVTVLSLVVVLLGVLFVKSIRASNHRSNTTKEVALEKAYLITFAGNDLTRYQGVIAGFKQHQHNNGFYLHHTGFGDAGHYMKQLSLGPENLAFSWKVLVGLVQFLSADEHSLKLSSTISGKLLSFWQRKGCCRKLTISDPNDPYAPIYVIYDENDDNLVLNHGDDYYTISIGDSSITYRENSVKENNWQGEVLSPEQAFEQATRTFNINRLGLLKEHGYVKEPEPGELSP